MQLIRQEQEKLQLLKNQLQQQLEQASILQDLVEI